MKYILICLAFLCTFKLLAQEVTTLSRKESKFAKTLFPETAITKELKIHAQDTAGWDVLRAGDRIYQVWQQDQLHGFLLSTQAMGRYEYFDYLLAFDAELSVLGLTIITYRSSHGAAICQRRWLDQFIGYSGEELRLGKEIDSLSGATISADALIRDLKRCHRLMIRLKEKDWIP